MQAAKIPAKDKNALRGQLQQIDKGITQSASKVLNTTVDQYQFESQTKDASILPANELVDELWVRIFPDDIFVHTHEKPLTVEEEKAAQEYWKTAWAVEADQEQLLSVWRMVCARYGKNRAAWVIRSLNPNTVSKKNAQAFNNKPVNYLFPGYPGNGMAK